MQNPQALRIPPANYKWQVMIVILIGMIMSMIDASIVNVAIPSMQVHFGANLDQIQWVLTGYMIAFATLMPLTAWFRDTIGYKMTYILSLSLFTVGSLLCGLAWNLPILVVARVIQAMGGGAIGPTGMAMLTEVFPPQERGKAMGFMGMGMILGPSIGPTLGGYLTNYFGWRSIFMVNLPIGAVGLYLAVRLLMPDTPHKLNKRGFDLWGYIFLSVFLVSFLLGFTDGQKHGWTSAYIMGCFITSLLCFIGFILVESQVKNRIIDLSLFKSPIFATAAAITVVRSIALFGGMFLLPLFMQQQMGYDSLQSGLMLLPGSLFMGIMMPIVGRMSDKIGSRYMVLFGMAATVVSLLMYIGIDTRWSMMHMIMPTFVRGIGMAFLMAPLMSTMLNSIPQNKTGMASSITNIIQQAGGAVGIAMFSTVMVNRVNFHINLAASVVNSHDNAFIETMKGLMHNVHDLGYTYGASAQISSGLIVRHVMKTASVASFQDTFLFAGIIACITFLPIFLLPTKPVFGPDTTKKQEARVLGEVGID